MCAIRFVGYDTGGIHRGVVEIPMLRMLPVRHPEELVEPRQIHEGLKWIVSDSCRR
jgi:hypothetical protein